MRHFSVKNFEKFQHYKDRTPPWIKLYNELLDDYEFGQLPDSSKWHLLAIWLLASRSNNRIPYDSAWVTRRINALEPVDLDVLIDAGFLIVDQTLHEVERNASAPLATCSPEKEVEVERETEAEKEKGCADAQPSKYAFAGSVVKIVPHQFETWKQSYAGGSETRLRALLQQRDDWLASPEATDDNRKRWFMSTSNWLANQSAGPPGATVIDWDEVNRKIMEA